MTCPIPRVPALFKCAGGKRELAPEIIRLMPASGWSTYVEPMVGGGAVYFALKSRGLLKGKRAVLADVDAEVVRLYLAVRDDPVAVAMELEELVLHHQSAKDPRAYYNDQRAFWNGGDKTPGRQLYLRYACYNGLWRHAKTTGFMNTPWNKERELSLPTADALMDASVQLEGTEILGADVRAITLGPGTLSYVDPPYDAEPKRGKDGSLLKGFVNYTKDGFSADDQQALIKHCKEACEKGAHVIYSNAATKNVRLWLKELWPTSALYVVMNKRTISCNGADREDAKEFLAVGGPTVQP